MPLWVPPSAAAVANPVAWADTFATDQLSSYTISPGSAVVSGGTLKAGAVNTETVLLKPNILLRNFVQQVKFTPVAISGESAGTVIGLICGYVDDNNHILAQWSWGSSSGDLSIYARESGSYTSVVTPTTGVTRPSAGQSRWLRFGRSGDSIGLAIFTSDPGVTSGLIPAAQFISSGVVASARQVRAGATAQPLPVGLKFALPSTSNWTLDDYTVWG